MSTHYYIIGLTAVLLTMAACTDKNTFTDGNNYVPALESRYLHLGTTAINMEATAGNKQLQVESITTPWQFRDFDSSWLSLNPVSGNSDQIVTIAATANPSAIDLRTSIFTFESTQSDYRYEKIVSVTQQNAAPYLRLANATDSHITVTAATGIYHVSIESNIEWRPVTSSAWLTAERIGKAIVITVSENTTDNERTATIRAEATDISATITVTQAPATDPAIVPEMTETLNYPNTGGVYVLTIRSEVGWTASSQQSWLQLTPTQGTAGMTELRIEATPNGSTDDRQGNVYISIGSTHRITIPIWQQGIYIDVTPTELTFTADAQAQQLTVESNTSWSVISKPEWLTVIVADGIPVDNVTGNATLQLSALDNWGESDRTGLLVLGQNGTTIQTKVSVKQQSRYFSVMPIVSVSHTSKGGTHQLTIKGNDPWTATSSSAWMQLSQRSGNGDISVTLTTPDNASIHSRADETTFTPSHLMPVTIRTTQAARYLNIDHTELTFFRTAVTSEAINISTDATYTVTSTDTSWLTVKQTGNTFTATVTENNTGKERDARIVVAMTGLVECEEYSVELPVKQYYLSPGITIATFSNDEQWDVIKSATAVITITGFGTDEKWD